MLGFIAGFATWENYLKHHAALVKTNSPVCPKGSVGLAGANGIYPAEAQVLATHWKNAFGSF